MEDSYLLRLPRELLLLWHAHRMEILISAGFLVAIVRLTLHWRSTKTKVILTPPLGSPVTEKPIRFPEVVQEKTVPPAQPVKTNGPRRVKGVKKVKKQEPAKDQRPPIDKIQPYIFYFTLGGSTKAYAEKLAESFILPDAEARVLPPQVHDLTDIDYDDFFISPPKYDSPGTGAFYTILIPSYNIDTELHNFLSHLQETHHDFRIDTAPLQTLAGYSVFGFGDMQEWPTEQEGYCVQAIEVDKWMAKLTGKKRAYPLGMGDVKDDVELRLEEWRRGVQMIVDDLSQGKGLGEGVLGSGDPVESGDEADEDYDDGETLITTTADLEDIRAPIPIDFTTSTKKSSSTTTGPPKAMVPVNSPTFNSLTKQGYSIIGTHSGVKICRWTKSALRGRGSCYKYSFYGIASHRCMEATPSLSCSNKCVFCWRHGSNPVGTTWRWQVDPPEQIFEGILAAHYKKIKSLRGVPGVRSERFAEAMRVRHCALSLVGEPIFYPHINQLLAMLHAQHISSFLVCNAQHPAHLAALGPVTQLYVSIDASNRDSLRKIDRPLHRDFWERFCDCMDILRAKRYSHRTVFRLTLVKGFNIADEVAGYADLVQRARPGFIEVKGVTYCGTSTSAGAGLSMANVPFWEEVQEFVLALAAELKTRGVENDGMEYGLAAEHQHSCCVLLADKERFYRKNAAGEGKWHTLIDYEKFFKLVERGGEFKAEDYVSAEPTADWAGWGRGGFDPRDVRVDRKGRPIEAKDEGRVVEI
ncbi:flavodoxin and radical SAM domain containing protein [Zymoseptoria brevis]|uniref:tRNA 4-demethylwyosine synthase (AdoMet-dependent) n=1 Tax=Zymoseptoria brevis TaxID=1047168 RepID=A0A0F4GDA9_9PEZI|nr:flavodoxin and radical SAM domain containing protein [Zymoseptoria brevis]